MTDNTTPTDPRRLGDITEGEVARPHQRQRHPEMAADVLSPRSDPGSIASSTPNRTSLPPLVTSTPSKAKLERASSYAGNMNKRLSTFSNASQAQSTRSRPQSAAFPIFHSSLPYTLVRDFAYGPLHPLFYGPLPEQPSDISTPASEVSRRLSDPPPPIPWHDRGWSTTESESVEQLPKTTYVDGPPWSEDEDIHSPIVTSSRGHKKHKSNIVDFDHTRGRKGYSDDRRTSYHSGNGFSLNDMEEAAYAHGGEYITYPPHQSLSQSLRAPSLQPPSDEASRRDSHFAALLPQRRFAHNEAGPPFDSDDEDMSETDEYPFDENRYSRQYQISIVSPEEEMHGRAVALFDFTRENDNELPLTEGQIILVSYRHGEGWLVAQDPKTGESGLVPEEYVRLLRDIEGGWNGLMNGAAPPDTSNGHESLLSPVSAGPEAKTPTQAEHKSYTPVISTFSTSTKDLEPYPKEMLGTPTMAEGAGFPKRRESSSDASQRATASEEKAAETSSPMQGVEASPEPVAQTSQSQGARS